MSLGLDAEVELGVDEVMVLPVLLPDDDIIHEIPMLRAWMQP